MLQYMNNMYAKKTISQLAFLQVLCRNQVESSHFHPKKRPETGDESTPLPKIMIKPEKQSKIIVIITVASVS